jgi:putative glutamine amidotransferase
MPSGPNRHAAGRKRPVIGVPAALARISWDDWDQRLAHFLPHAYVRALQGAGASVVVLPSARQDAAGLLALLDGLLLAGGTDLDPLLTQGSGAETNLRALNSRDAFEVELARHALECDTPVLGICRGMQVLNVAMGGTLINHLPDVVRHDEHQKGSTIFNEHPVRLAPLSRIATAIGATALDVRSLHHQGIDSLGEGTKATGWCELDDTIEAIEWPENRFAIGVLWHPEQATELSRLMLAFVDAADTVGADAEHRYSAGRPA